MKYKSYFVISSRCYEILNASERAVFTEFTYNLTKAYKQRDEEGYAVLSLGFLANKLEMAVSELNPTVQSLINLGFIDVKEIDEVSTNMGKYLFRINEDTISHYDNLDWCDITQINGARVA